LSITELQKFRGLWARREVCNGGQIGRRGKAVHRPERGKSVCTDAREGGKCEDRLEGSKFVY